MIQGDTHLPVSPELKAGGLLEPSVLFMTLVCRRHRVFLSGFGRYLAIVTDYLEPTFISLVL